MLNEGLCLDWNLDLTFHKRENKHLNDLILYSFILKSKKKC